MARDLSYYNVCMHIQSSTVQYNISVFTAGILEKQPTLRQLLNYKDQIGREWYNLGKILLGEKIETIKEKYPLNRQCSQMLRAWLEGKNHTWGRFIDALREADRTDIAEEILQNLQGMNICMHVCACIRVYMHAYVHAYMYACFILINKYPLRKVYESCYITIIFVNALKITKFAKLKTLK